MTLIPVLNQSLGSARGRDKKRGSLSSSRRPYFREIFPHSASAFAIQSRQFGRYLTFSGVTHRVVLSLSFVPPDLIVDDPSLAQMEGIRFCDPSTFVAGEIHIHSSFWEPMATCPQRALFPAIVKYFFIAIINISSMVKIARYFIALVLRR